MTAVLSKTEKLLCAAAILAKEGQEEFSAEDLAVQAHKMFPQDFSLKGHPEYPDSNVVFIQVMGRKAPLIIRGWLEKTGTKQYRLTAKGADDLNRLEGYQSTGNVRLGRPLEDGLARLLTSAACELYAAGREQEITFHQFCRFSELSARDRWQKVRGKLTSLEHLVGEARKLGEAGEVASIWIRDHNERVSPEQLRLLEPLLSYLMDRFKSEMTEWKRKALG